MNTVWKLILAAATAALMALSGCGGGGGDGSLAGIGGTGKIASGTITGFGSIWVNGLEVETPASAEVLVVGSDEVIRVSADGEGDTVLDYFEEGRFDRTRWASFAHCSSPARGAPSCSACRSTRPPSSKACATRSAPSTPSRGPRASSATSC